MSWGGNLHLYGIQIFSFVIVSWSGNLDLYGPNHLDFQLVRGNFDMYGPKHLVFQLLGRRRGNLNICGYIQTLSSSVVGEGVWELGYVWTQTFMFFKCSVGEGELRYTRIYPNI